MPTRTMSIHIRFGMKILDDAIDFGCTHQVSQADLLHHTVTGN